MWQYHVGRQLADRLPTAEHGSYCSLLPKKKKKILSCWKWLECKSDVGSVKVNHWRRLWNIRQRLTSSLKWNWIVILEVSTSTATIYKTESVILKCQFLVTLQHLITTCAYICKKSSLSETSQEFYVSKILQFWLKRLLVSFIKMWWCCSE